MNLEQILTENAARRKLLIACKLALGMCDRLLNGETVTGVEHLAVAVQLRAAIAIANGDNAPEVIDALVAEGRRLETLLAARPER